MATWREREAREEMPDEMRYFVAGEWGYERDVRRVGAQQPTTSAPLGAERPAPTAPPNSWESHEWPARPRETWYDADSGSWMMDFGIREAHRRYQAARREWESEHRGSVSLADEMAARRRERRRRVELEWRERQRKGESQ